MHLCVFEDDQAQHLFPLTRTRATYDLHLGMHTLLERTHAAFGEPPTVLHARQPLAEIMAQEYDLLARRLPEGLDVLFVNGRYVAEAGAVLERLRRASQGGEPGRVFVKDTSVVAAWVPDAPASLIEADALTRATFEAWPEEEVEGATMIARLWDLLETLRPALRRDFEARFDYKIYERPGADVQDGARLVRGERIYVAPGATIRPGAILNAEDGPVYIGRDAVVMENAVVRGPVYLGPKGQIRIGASIEGSAFGPQVKVGGEVHDTVIHSLSNKVHAGFLGHAYVGRWCNLGADTNNSNLKNDYDEVRVYNPALGDFEATGRQFAGLLMGDHVKCGINTMFNTGTVVEPFCNIYGVGFPPRYLPPFSWGNPSEGFSEYRLEKALRVAEAVMARRDHVLTAAERDLFTALAEKARTLSQSR